MFDFNYIKKAWENVNITYVWNGDISKQKVSGFVWIADQWKDKLFTLVLQTNQTSIYEKLTQSWTQVEHISKRVELKFNERA